MRHQGAWRRRVGDAPFAYVGIFKARVSVGFFQGAGLPDPARLLAGSGRYMRQVRLVPGAPIDESALAALIAEAYRDVGIRSMLAG